MLHSSYHRHGLPLDFFQQFPFLRMRDEGEWVIAVQDGGKEVEVFTVTNGHPKVAVLAWSL